MQISGLPVSTAFGASDVLAIEINGVTYKITGATLAAALQSMGDYLTAQDIANNLTTTDEGYVLDARQGKALLDTLEAIGASDVGAVAVDQGTANAGKVLAVGNDGNVTTGKAVRPDVAQTLTAAEQAQARGNIGAASATELAAETAAREAADSDLKSAINNSLSFTSESGHMINAKGNVGVATNSNATDYIPVFEGEVIYFEHLNLSGVRSICTYNSSKIKVRTVVSGSSSTEYSVTVQEGEAYIRATGGNAPATATVLDIFGIVSKTRNDLDEYIDIASSRIQTLYNALPVSLTVTCTDGYFIDKNGNESSSANSCMTGYIPVFVTEKVKLENLKLTSTRAVCTYDANMSYIGTLITGSDATEYTVTVTEGVSYIRATGSSGEPVTATVIDVLDVVRQNAIGVNSLTHDVGTVSRIAPNGWQQGTPENGYSSNRIHEKLGYVKGTVTIQEDDGLRIAILTYSDETYSTKTFDSGWKTEEYYVDVDGYLVILARKSDESAIQPSEGEDIVVIILESLSTQVQKITNDIADLENDISVSGNAGNPNGFKAIAHQGGKWVVPPCTLPAVKFAKRQGFRATENDLRKTSDDVWVMWHDDTLAVCGHSEVTVEGSTYDELMTYDVGSYISSEFAGTHICTFKEWLVLCKELGMEPWIDCKAVIDETDAIELFSIVRRLGMARSVVWVGRTRIIKTYADEYATVAILDNPTTQNINSLRSFISEGENPKCSFDVQLSQLDETQVEAAFDAGYNVGAWWDNQSFTSESDVVTAVKAWVAKGIQYITLNNYNVEKILAKSD